MYGKFIYNGENTKEPIDVVLYQVIPYKNIDDNLKTIRVINPNCKIDELLSNSEDLTAFNEKFTKIVEIKQVYL